MTGVRQRFTPLQRLLHWLMAVCILAMLFIGVGMVSTVTPKYLPLVAIHKSLGIAILVLALIRLAARLRYGAPALPADLPEPMKLAAHAVALRALCPHDRNAADRLGNAVGRPPIRSWCSGACVFRRSCRRATVCIPGSGTRISIWLLRFSRLVLMHVAAALFHALVRRDGVFESMAGVPLHGETAPVRQHGSPQMN